MSTPTPLCVHQDPVPETCDACAYDFRRTVLRLVDALDIQIADRSSGVLGELLCEVVLAQRTDFVKRGEEITRLKASLEQAKEACIRRTQDTADARRVRDETLELFTEAKKARELLSDQLSAARDRARELEAENTAITEGITKAVGFPVPYEGSWKGLVRRVEIDRGRLAEALLELEKAQVRIGVLITDAAELRTKIEESETTTARLVQIEQELAQATEQSVNLRQDIDAILYSAFMFDDKPHRLFSDIGKIAQERAAPEYKPETERLMTLCYERAHILNRALSKPVPRPRSTKPRAKAAAKRAPAKTKKPKTKKRR